jgi:hypothetical protein
MPLAAPDAAAVAMDFANPVEGHAMDFASIVQKLEGEVVICREAERRKRDADDAVFDPVIVADLEVGNGVHVIPADAVKQVLNRLHACGSRMVVPTVYHPEVVLQGQSDVVNCQETGRDSMAAGNRRERSHTAYAGPLVDTGQKISLPSLAGFFITK